jgi:hypothetical protein
MVETEEGQHWKRHADQIKDRIAPAWKGPTPVSGEISGEGDTLPFPEVPVTARPLLLEL